jgi:multiple sugar transport system substrate-binding protein
MDRRELIKGLGALGLGALGGMIEAPSAFAASKMWFNTLFHGGDADAMETIVKKIEAANPDLAVDLTQGAWTEYYAQLYNSVVAEAAPQLGIVDDFRFESVAGVLYDVENTPAGNILDLMGAKTGDFSQWEISLIDGKPLGIPLDQNGFGIYYNKDIFKKAGLDPDRFPETRSEFEAACEAIKKTGKVAFHPALSGETRYIRRAWLGLLWGLNGSYIESGKASFNNDKGRESLQYLVDMVHGKGWNAPGTNGINQFLAGELGMLQNGSWFYLTVEKAKIDYGCAMPPKFFDRQVAWGGYHLFVLPKQSDDSEGRDNLKTTARFLKAFLPHYSLWGQMGGAVPMLKGATDDPGLRQSNVWKRQLAMFSDAAAKGLWQAEPRHPKITDVDNAVEPYTQEAYNGTMSVADALAKAEADVNKALAA